MTLKIVLTIPFQTGFWLLWPQCDHIGQYLQVLRTKFLTKVAQIFSNILGCCENGTFYVKLICILLGATFGENVGTFYSNFWSHWFWVSFLLAMAMAVFQLSHLINRVGGSIPLVKLLYDRFF